MLRSALLSLTIISGSGAMAQGLQPVNDQPFLELIGGIEGPDGYDDIVLGLSLIHI